MTDYIDEKIKAWHPARPISEQLGKCAMCGVLARLDALRGEQP